MVGHEAKQVYSTFRQDYISCFNQSKPEQQ